jgi:hypothetical protein
VSLGVAAVKAADPPASVGLVGPVTSELMVHLIDEAQGQGAVGDVPGGIRQA